MTAVLGALWPAPSQGAPDKPPPSTLAPGSLAQPRIEIVPQLVHGLDAHLKVEFSPDERTAVSMHRGRIHLWDIETGALLHVLSLPGVASYHDLRFTPDGRQLLSGNYDLAITTWDLATASAVRTIPGKPPAGGPGLVFSGDGRRAAWIEQDGFLRLFDVPGAKLLRTFGGKGSPGKVTAATLAAAVLLKNAFYHMSISRDGAVGLVVRGLGPYEVWDLDGGVLLQKLPRGNPPGHVAMLSPDGRHVLAASYSGTVTLYNARTGEAVRTLAGHDTPQVLAISEDGRRALSSDFKAVRLWDLQDGSLVQTLPGTENVRALAFSAKGNRAIVGALGRLEVWDLETGTMQKTLTGDKAPLAAIQSTACMADGDRAVSATYEQAQPPSLSFWDLRTLRLVQTNPIAAGLGAEVKLGAGGTRAWSFGTTDRRLLFWDTLAPAGRTVTDFAGEGYPVPGFAIGADGRYALAAVVRSSSDARKKPAKGASASAIELMRWDAGGGVNVKRAIEPSYGTPAALSRDGRYAAVKEMKGDQKPQKLRVWDMEKASLVRAIDTDTLYIWSAAFSPDSRRIAFADMLPFNPECRLRLVDIASGATIHTLKGGISAPYSLAFSHDGRLLAAGLGDGTVRVFSTDTGALVHTLEGHTQYVRAVAFSDDGRYVLSGSEDGTMRLFRLDKPPQSMVMVSGGGEWLVYSSDGYFDASRKGGTLVAAAGGLVPYRIDQLAVTNNRPDLILERMGLGSGDVIAHYRARYERRLKKLGLRGDPQTATFDKAPEAHIAALKTSEKFADITIDVTARGRDLFRYNIFINDVPLFGAAGKPTSGRQQRLTERVELGSGRNKIEVSALDAGGAESLRAFRIIEYSGSVTGDLYFLGFGVSRYKNPKYNLEYPHKDILDLAEVLKRAQGTFRHVHTKTYVNEEVTVENIRRAKEFFRPATVDDTVVLSVAGHGVHARDAAAEYYFVTYETDGSRLSQTAANFDLIEDLLLGIAPRKKLFLMDTCESGEKEEDETAPAGVPGQRGLVPRTTRALVIDAHAQPGAGKPRPFLFDRDRYVYNDLSRRSGAIVLSSSRGSEYSWERKELQNGVFTEEILVALTSDRADKNKDGLVSTDELRDDVMREVPKRTEDQQHPTVDRDNLEASFAFPVVADAAFVVTRTDPIAAAPRAVDMPGGAPRPAARPPKSPLPQGCGCAMPGRYGTPPGIAGGLLAAALFAMRARRRKR